MGKWINAWGNASCIKKLFVLQKRAVRIINKIGYRGHTDPIFKREKILKVADLNKVYVSLFMFDQQNEGLPSSFKQFINKRNVTDVSMTTRQSTLLPIDRHRTTFSSMQPIHYFVKLWNNIDEVVRKLKSRNACKHVKPCKTM